MSNRPRVYVAYTGGTIGMNLGDQGLESQPGLLADVFGVHPEFQPASNPNRPDFIIREYDDLIDSSNATPEDWYRIATDIKDRYDDFDGFVVLHGTDTLAYTSSALSFLLENLAKPVVVTGSQIPAVQSRSDGISNIAASIELAGNHPELHEVVVCFGSKILRGNRTTKVSSQAFDAFDTPMVGNIGRVGINIRVFPSRGREERNRKLAARGRCFVRKQRKTPIIGCIRLFPGISHKFVRSVLSSGLHGLVVEAYGAGNAPDRNIKLLEALRTGVESGIVVVAVTQPLHGAASLGAYQAGAALREAGVTSGYDMTTEAAVTKLHYLLSSNAEVEKVRELMSRSLRGELAPIDADSEIPAWRLRPVEIAPFALPEDEVIVVEEDDYSYYEE